MSVDVLVPVAGAGGAGPLVEPAPSTAEVVPEEAPAAEELDAEWLEAQFAALVARWDTPARRAVASGTAPPRWSTAATRDGGQRYGRAPGQDAWARERSPPPLA